MNIECLTIGEARQIAEMFGHLPLASASCSPWEIGKNYLIRTVTMTQTGRLVAVYPDELVLDDAAWIPNTGRFASAVKAVIFDEVEPFPGRIIVGRHAVIDASEISTLPREQK